MDKKFIIERPSENLVMIAVNTTLAPFQLAYNIEQQLDTEFYRMEDFLSYKKDKDREYPFTFLLNADETNGLTYFLLSNKTTEDNNALLIDGLPKIDFFLLIYGRDGEKIAPFVCKKVSQMQQVMLSKIVYPVQVKEEKTLSFTQTSLDLFAMPKVSTPKKRSTKKSEINESIISALQEDIECFVSNNAELVEFR
ncbi:MAG: IPExxxVDY family protein [Bacteroidales bacterium]|nr:IPExxxVDY family protein [Bacteroidales bacterium]MBQ9312637.1 IPExxxVDY family protein [Bacteroidales bacterium]